MPYKKYSLPEYPIKFDMWDELQREHRPIVVYGMGNGADKLLCRFEKYGIRVSDFFASDGFVRGHSFHGMRVKSFSEIKEEYSDFVIVLSFASNREEVLEMITNIDKAYDLYIPDMPVAGEEYFDKEFYNSHYDEIVRAYSALSCESSKNAFAAMVSYKLSGRGEYLFSTHSDIEEIYSMIPAPSYAVDAGAYNGDTVRVMLSVYPSIQKIYAFEPDRRNFKKLNKFIEGNGLSERVEAYNAAVWSSTSGGELIGSGNRNSSVNSTASYKSNEESISLVRIDGLSIGKIDFIKYDVEGAEMEALRGSEGMIEKYHPSLLISAYHRSEDIFSIINYLSERYPFYRLYLRRTRCVPAWELDILAIDEI